jgi:adenylate kinase family enzyme
MRRVVVVGTSGSGKTTLAAAIAARVAAPHVELDAVYWGPGWTPRSDFAERVRAIVADEAWVIDGGYAAVRPLIWPRADTIVWIDYPMRVVFNRVLRRTLRRCWRREALWNGNAERMWTQLTSRESILLWVINTWRRRRRDYPVLLASPLAAHARRVRLRTPAATARWLATVAEPVSTGS